MPLSQAPKRMILSLPGLYKVTSRPSVDYTFFEPYDMAVLRPYLWDPDNRLFLSDQGRQRTLLRADDAMIDAIYGKAIAIDPAAGDILDYGIDPDEDLGDSWSLTFVIQPMWDLQPTAASSLHPFRHPGTNNPRLGYNEETGTVEALGWYGLTTAGTVSLTYAEGWLPRRLMAVTLVTDAVADKSYLWVNGQLRVTLNERIKANSAGNLTMRRTATQSGTTAKTNLEAYFMHSKALVAADIQALHKMFTTGYTDQSRIVCCFMALGMAMGEIEHLGWRAENRNKPDLASDGTLTRLALDYSVRRNTGETDESLRKRLRNRLFQIFSEGTLDQVITSVAAVTGLDKTDLLVKNLVDENGDYCPASFAILLPPASQDLIPDAEGAIEATKLAGVKGHVGTTGSFAWDIAERGWGFGAWYYIR